MAKQGGNILLILGVVAIVVVAMNWNTLFGQPAAPAPAPVTPPSGGGVTPPAANGACPDTLATSFEGDSVNPLNASKTDYQAQTFRLIPGGNFGDFMVYTTTTAVQGGTAVNLKCGHSYDLYPLATLDAVNSVPYASLGAVSGQSASKVMVVPKLVLLQSKVYDNSNHAAVYEDGDAAAGTMDALASVYYSTSSNYTGTAMGDGGFIDWDFTMQSVATDGQFGNSQMGVYIAVDADKSEYDTPSLWIHGLPLPDVKGTGELTANDEAVLASYEYIFKVSGVDFKTAPVDVRMYLAAKAGQNPSADPVLRFVGKGYYAGADGVTIKSHIFNEATNSEILTATAQTMTVTIT